MEANPMKLTSDDVAIYDDLRKAQDMKRARYDVVGLWSGHAGEGSWFPSQRR